MKATGFLVSAVLALCLPGFFTAGCSAYDVQARQQFISNVQNDVLDRRAARTCCRIHFDTGE